MKKTLYVILALIGGLFASCMDDHWDTPTNEQAEENIGNQYIEESNVITIAQLKSDCSSAISSGGMKQITKPTQIKAVVTGNDVQGNLYNEISIEDNTGAILVTISQGALYGILPIGQEILVELNGLYVGSYGKQPQIGMPYTSTSGAESVGRMSRTIWNLHYKIIHEQTRPGTLVNVNPMTVTDINSLNIDTDAARLITLKGVTIDEADGKAVFAPTDGSVRLTSNCANRTFKGISSSKLVLRTSTYSDFAGSIMPTGAVDVTGIATRYNNTWQILMRSLDDIKTAN